MRVPLTREDGFSLVETLVATLILAVAVLTLAQLFGIGARSLVASRHTTYATVLAGQKVEELRALDIGEIGPSPPAALNADTPGWVDYLDQSGRTLAGPGRPRQTMYVRRWSIGADAEGAWRIEVLVVPAASSASKDGPGGPVGRSSEQVHVVTVRAARTL